MRLDSEIIKVRYNRNVELYNNGIKEEILNVLASNEDRFQQRLEELKIKVHENIEFFKVDMKAVLRNLYVPKEESLSDLHQDQQEIDLLNQIYEQLYFEAVETDNYIDQPEGAYRKILAKINELFSYKGLDNQLSRPTSHIRKIIKIGEEIRRIESVLRAYEVVINKITDDLFPSNLDKYGELSDSEREIIDRDGEYIPHHNTREGLIDDLRTIINEIRHKSRFFHKDGNIKHTKVAKFAVDQDWFSDKHGYGNQGLHDHIKEIFLRMER